jgi:cytochrome P450 family 6
MCSCINLWLGVFSCAVFLAYLFIKWSYGYWKRRGIQSPTPSFPYGNMWNVGTTIHTCHLMQKFYNQFRDSAAPFVGLYVLLWPSVMCLNLDFVKCVMAKDFQNFHDRGIYYNEKGDPLSAHLFALDGDKWRTLRYKLTPTFTSGKMKTMFVTLVAVVEQFQSALEHELKMGHEVEMREMLGRFTTDVIGSCAFGLDCNSLKDPNAEFRVRSRKVFENPPLSQIEQILVRNFRGLAKVMNIKVFSTDVSDFFMRIVKETIDYRELNAVERKDFMDLLIAIKNKSGEEGLTIEEVAAQALIFFLAGFETSSTTMTFALYELARNQEVQDKARACVQEVLKRHNGALTYDAMAEMTFIDQCINGKSVFKGLQNTIS